jgi:hypothetical protein
MDTAIMFKPPLPYHRQNRRRERPGARKRHALAHKESISAELEDGYLLARDSTLSFPYEHKTPPLRQNYDRSWQRWKARETEQRVREEEDRQRRVKEMAEEQLRMFGGEVQDDVSLCLSMLGVVYSLWGDVDYTDP